jgi:uncharacterized membrane protein
VFTLLFGGNETSDALFLTSLGTILSEKESVNMKPLWSSLYTLTLALWVGGMALFTFIVTPAIFRSFGRDAAGAIVGHLFPGYFLTNLILAGMALVLYMAFKGGWSSFISRLSLVLLTMAVLLNSLIVFKLHPEAVKAKSEVTSFERESPDSPARRKFAKLHGISAALNLLLLVDGVALLVIRPESRKY